VEVPSVRRPVTDGPFASLRLGPRRRRGFEDPVAARMDALSAEPGERWRDWRISPARAVREKDRDFVCNGLRGSRRINSRTIGRLAMRFTMACTRTNGRAITCQPSHAVDDDHRRPCRAA
jgi:hypothetical protein